MSWAASMDATYPPSQNRRSHIVPMTIPNVTGEMILTKGECAYQEVLNGFKDASYVTVVTYNISKNQYGLLDQLCELAAAVRVIAAIPGRLDAYFGYSAKAKYLKKNAADAIELYLKKLAPEQFGPQASVSLCFDNHAKIIMTEKIAYVGSANFSEESANNWEAGIIVRDPEALKKLDSFVDAIERDSVRYYGKGMLDRIVPLATARQRLAELNGVLAEDFEKLELEELKEAVKQMRDAIADSDKAWSEAFEETGPVYPRIDAGTLSRIEDWFDESGEMVELEKATKRLSDSEGGGIDAGELFVNNDGIVPDSEFEDAIEDFKTERDDRVRGVQEASEELQSYIAVVCQQVDDVCRDIAEHIKKIDNTK
jgi:hypothetical protein